MLRKVLTTLLVLGGLDFIWLGFLAKGFYNRELAPFRRGVTGGAAILVYLLLCWGINRLVLPAAGGSLRAAFWGGAFFGLIVYGVYDLTNLATLTDWSLTLTVVDILWGMTVCGLTSLIVRWLLG